MSILIYLSATLRTYIANYSPANGIEMTLENHISAKDLALRLNLPLEEIKIIMINGRREKPESMIKNGDRVGFFPSIAGG
jgi:molybdopterin converting factor small subunit